MKFSLTISTPKLNPMMYSHWDVQDALKDVSRDLNECRQSGFILDVDGHTVGEWSIEHRPEELALSPYTGDDGYYRD